MKILILLLFPILLLAQTEKLLGKIQISNLKNAPYNEWFDKGYEKYQPNGIVIEKIKKLKNNNISFKIFMGTWCGDTKRELPKMIKVLIQAGFNEKQIELIALDNVSSNYKQSPNGEELGWDIFRVTTFIVLKNGIELNRIIEFPISSLERDLLTICEERNYASNYQKTFTTISEWDKEGILSDANVSIYGLARVLKNEVNSEGELNSYGYVLLGQKKYNEAITVLLLNCQLYPNSSNCFDSLAEAYLISNNKDLAIKHYKKALELDKDNIDLKTLIQKLEFDKK